jgi:ribA/ribD-fused uncharacterized protein
MLYSWELFSGDLLMTSFSIPGTHIAVTPFYDKSRPLYCLVNFSQHAITIDGVNYPTTEHYFQAQKFNDQVNDKSPAFLAEVKKRGNGPAEALAVAREWTKNWNDAQKKQWYARNEIVMEQALRAKLKQYPTISQELINTGNSCLVEDTSERNEPIWGWGNDGAGTNKLGILWMTLRNELFRAQGKTDLIVDPGKLYAEVQKARLVLGQRNNLMQTWPDAKPLQSTNIKPNEPDNIFILAEKFLKFMGNRQTTQDAISNKGEKLKYGISELGHFYIKGTDRNGSPIEVSIINNQLYENNRQLAISTWADWALPIVRAAITASLSAATKVPTTPTEEAPKTSSKKGSSLSLLKLVALLGVALVIIAGALALKFTMAVALLIGMATACTLGYIQFNSTRSNTPLHRNVIDDSAPVDLPQHSRLLYKAALKVTTPAISETEERKNKITLSR